MKILMLDIPGFPGYRAGSDGHIYSFKIRERVDFSIVPRRLKAYPGITSKYLCVHLRCNLKTAQRTVHSLVCSAFHGARPLGLETSHLNGNLLDNRPENLTWETRRSNLARKLEHGTYDGGTRNSRALFNAAQLRDIVRRLVNGETARSIAKRYGCNERAIGKIKRGERYRLDSGVAA